MLKAVAPTIDNVPRHALLLSNLRSDQRELLFKELCEKAGKELEPGVKVFTELGGSAQAEVLVKLLADYDAAMSGYIVIGVTLPIRTSKHSTNEKKWAEFAEKIEETINGVVKAGYQGASITRFENHGVIIVGFKPPPSSMVGSLVPVMMSPMGTPSPEDLGPGPDQSASQHHLIRDLVMKGKVRIKASLSLEEKKEEVKKIVKEVVGGSSAEDIRLAVELLDKHIEMHMKHGGCTGKDCELVDYCTILRATLLEQRDLQLC